MDRRAVILLALFTVAARPLAAQAVLEELPVSGSLTYNALIYDRAHGADGRAWGLRLAGRLALRLTSRTYLGIGVGSWSRETLACAAVQPCPGFIVAHSEAVVHQLYAQHYVWRNKAFLRAGSGAALTRTLQLLGGFIEVTESWRPVVAVGVGTDIRISSAVYLTPSLDVAMLLGVDRGTAELRSAVMPGLGLTLR